MKKIALLLTLVMLMSCGVVLTSCCCTSSETEDSETKGDAPSAYDALNEDEKKVYNAMKDFASQLDDPSSLKLIDLKVGKTHKDDTEKSIFVKLSASNAFGSQVTEVYVMDSYGRLDNGGSAWYSYAGAWYHYGSVAKINAALQEYFNSMGW